MEKTNTNPMEWEIAERGGVYEFYDNNKRNTGNYVVIVSSNARSRDRFVNILMPGNSPVGTDVMPIEINGEYKYLHCGMISYTTRDRLGRKVAHLSTDTMRNIEKLMAKGLGITMEADYKTLYEDLVSRLVKREEDA